EALPDNVDIFERSSQANIGNVYRFVRCRRLESRTLQEAAPGNVHLNHALHAVAVQLVVARCRVFDGLNLGKGELGLLGTQYEPVPQLPRPRAMHNSSAQDVEKLVSREAVRVGGDEDD